MVRLAAHRPNHAGTPRAAIVSAVRPVSLPSTAPHQSHLAALWLRGPSQWRIAAPELLLFTGPADGELLLFEDSCEINSHCSPSLDVVVCQVGNRVGVKRCSDDTMHIFIDGEDMGPAATAVPKVHTRTHTLTHTRTHPHTLTTALNREYALPFIIMAVCRMCMQFWTYMGE